MSNLERFLLVVYAGLMALSIFILIKTWRAVNWVTSGFDTIAVIWIIGMNVILVSVILYKRRKKNEEK